ncbi:MAG: UDP-N-acetylmuramoyl-tripeptide--D-alanyl-D-alanine ligase [Patescibacteria group bacterium]|nr:UDP-N-acetylmuramoyl-tripeptide--D-alanyl-D-alanine ligase [Patescibacteria group bacterium]
MNFIIPVVIVLWFFRMAKNVLFWVYLWQLKEYHIGRFTDHFRTYRGSHLFINSLIAVKIVLIRFLFVFSQANILVFILYGLEAGKVFFDVLRRSITRPVFTLKTLILSVATIVIALVIVGILFFVVGLSGNMFLVSLVVLDLASPLLVSVVVLLFQPIAVYQRNSMIQQARKKRAEMSSLLVIGVTGSYGKSSVKELLFHIVSAKYKTLKTQKNNNSEVGISQTILRGLREEHEVFVCEMGAYNKGGIRLLASIAKPKIAIVTGINEQHMATFGSQKNIIEGKYELVESLDNKGVSIFNGFNPYCKEMYERTQGKKRKIGKEGELWAENLIITKHEISFTAVHKEGESAAVQVRVGGPFLENILLAQLASLEVGIGLKESAHALSSFTGGLKVKKGINGADIIDSSYSMNPTGAVSDIDYMNLWQGKKVVVMPSLIELGSSSKEVHKRIGEKIGQMSDYAIITTKDRFKEISEEAVAQGMKKDNIVLEEQPAVILKIIQDMVKEGDVVLLEGRVPQGLLKLLA